MLLQRLQNEYIHAVGFDKEVYKTLIEMYEDGILDAAINEEGEIVFFLANSEIIYDCTEKKDS